MATDATGTPTTTLGIPKYNTAADIPSGKGFNAAMDFIDDLIEARGTTVPGASGVKVWNNTTKAWETPAGATGSKFLRDDGTFATAGTSGYGTALPGSPVDGQEYILVDSLTAPSYQWLFRYNASATGTYKWEFTGGPGQVGEITTPENVTLTTYTDPATPGPSVTAPRAGVYTIRIAGESETAIVANGQSQGRIAAKLGAAATSDLESVLAQDPYSSAAGNVGASVRSFQREMDRTLAAGDVVKMQYKVSAGTHAFRNRRIVIVPVRVI